MWGLVTGGETWRTRQLTAGNRLLMKPLISHSTQLSNFYNSQLLHIYLMWYCPLWEVVVHPSRIGMKSSLDCYLKHNCHQNLTVSHAIFCGSLSSTWTLPLQFPFTGLFISFLEESKSAVYMYMYKKIIISLNLHFYFCAQQIISEFENSRHQDSTSLHSCSISTFWSTFFTCFQWGFNISSVSRASHRYRGSHDMGSNLVEASDFFWAFFATALVASHCEDHFHFYSKYSLTLYTWNIQFRMALLPVMFFVGSE